MQQEDLDPITRSQNELRWYFDYIAETDAMVAEMRANDLVNRVRHRQAFNRYQQELIGILTNNITDTVNAAMLLIDDLHERGAGEMPIPAEIQGYFN